MAIWEKILIGLLAVTVTFLFWPGVKRVVEESRRAENPNWSAALIPLAIVAFFVGLLIVLANS